MSHYRLVRYAASAQGQTPAPTLYSIRSPVNTTGSSTTSDYGVIEYANPPHLWGTGGGGWTVLRKIKPRATTGYVAQFWHTDGSSFETTIPDGYWGFHPYPQNASNTGTSWYWEIAIDQGDYVNNLNASPIAVQTSPERWYYQALQVVRNNASSKTLTFWTDLENVSNDTIIEVTITTSNYGETTPTGRKLTKFNSPWMGDYQEERGACDEDWCLVYTPYESVTDIIANADVTDPDSIMSYTGATNLFWGKKGFTSINGTANELLCDYGTGRSFVRNDSASILSVVSR